ncbi:MAG: hypothetical protein HYT15_00610 [Candidatus Magasanikbacteria bacterium]|nr:hypothetical protein [Candidatus Magasanikbacteria bacterium]
MPKGKQREEAERVWQAGWKVGHAGCEATESNPTWRLGYHQGVVALEEAQNGEPPDYDSDVGDPGSWELEEFLGGSD